MSKNINDNIILAENAIRRTAKIVLNEGYSLATTGGYFVGSDIDELNHEKGFGITKPIPMPQPKGIIEWICNALSRHYDRPLHIGTLYINCLEREAKKENWVLNVFGRNKLPELTELIEKIFKQQEKKPQITINIESEQPRIVRYFNFNSDSYYDADEEQEDYCFELIKQLKDNGMTLDDI